MDMNASVNAKKDIKQQPANAGPQRVISLLGAATETLYRLGLGNRLVGRSHECDYPPHVLSLPCISRPRLNVDASSADIDAAVRERSAAGEPIYKLDDAALGDIASFDLLIAQDRCRVCAVTPDDVQNSDVMACATVPQLVLKPATLKDCLEDVNRIAEAMGVPERGVALRRTLEERLDRVRLLGNGGYLAGAPETVEVQGSQSQPMVSGKARPRVALLEWCDPIMGCGYWIPELIHTAGGEALFCPPPGGATPTISFQSLLDAKPDVVVFALCGFGPSRAASEILSSREWGDANLDALAEVCSGNMFVVDGNYLVNRSGPRVVESCEALAEAIHEDMRGHFGHFGTDLLTTFEEAARMCKMGVITGSIKVRPEPFYEEKESVKLGCQNDNEAKTADIEQPKDGPGEVVARQLKHLQTGDINAAFALNSCANRDRWCGAERFAAVLQSHNDFKRLLTESAVVGPSDTKNGVATVFVSLPSLKDEEDGNGNKGNESEVILIWTMIAEIPTNQNKGNPMGLEWRTEKVGLAQ